MKRNHIFYVVVAMGLSLLGVWALVQMSPPAQFARHHNQWLAHPISDYRYTIQLDNPLIGYPVSITTVEVRDGKLLQWTSIDNSEICPDLCTIEGLFDKAARALQSAQVSNFEFYIGYHARYGFPESICTGYADEMDSYSCWNVTEFEPTE